MQLDVHDLSKKYNRKEVFQGLSFTHSSGVLGIAGSNGSGKSSLLKCLSFLLKPSNGTFNWSRKGQNLTATDWKKISGYAAPYISLYPELSISENLRFLLNVNAIPVFESKLEELLKQVQVFDLKEQLFGSLSTGQQQRAKLAAALVRDPEILVLDEPGSNLDEKGHRLVAEIVDEFRKQQKLVLLASNDPKEIELCDQVVELGGES